MSISPKKNLKQSELEKSLGFVNQEVDNIEPSLSETKLAIPSKPKYALTVPMNVRIPIELRQGLDRLIEAESTGYSKVTLQNLIVSLIKTVLVQKGYMDK
jgi:hypothetical protein